MKLDSALRHLFVERQRNKEFLWNSLVNQLRIILESKLLIVTGLANEGTSLPSHVFHQRQTLCDK